MEIHVAFGEHLRDLVGERRGVLFGDALAVVEGNHLVVGILQLFDKGDGGFGYIAALGEDLFVVEADYVARPELEAVHRGVAHGVGDHARDDVVDGVRHVGLVDGDRTFRIERERSRVALRHVFGGYHMYVAAGHEVLCLLRREDNVGVVGEDEHVGGVYLLHGAGNVLRRGIHGLSALDDLIAQQVFEDIGKAVARADGEHAHLLLFGLQLGLELAVLFEHVLYLDPVEFAQLERVGKRYAGSVGVDVHLDELQIAYADDAVAYLHELFFEPVDIGKRSHLL